MNIKICLPYYREVKFSAWLIDSVNQCKAYGFSFQAAESTLIDKARNYLFTRTEDEKDNDPNIDYYFCVDHDLEWTVQDILTLVDAGKDIIGASYTRREDPFKYNSGYWCKERGRGWAGNYITTDNKGIMPVHWHSAGGLLVSKRALDRMVYPWFDFYKVSYGRKRTTVHDDIGFCINATDSGIKIYNHCDVILKHHSSSQESPRPVPYRYATEHLPVDLQLS